MTTPYQFFLERFINIKNTVEFQPSWKSEQNRLDGGCRVRLNPAQVARSVTDDNRRVILVGTPVGTVVVYEKDQYPLNKDGMVVSSKPLKIETILTDVPMVEGVQTFTSLVTLIGDPYNYQSNIGSVMDHWINKDAQIAAYLGRNTTQEIAKRPELSSLFNFRK